MVVSVLLLKIFLLAAGVGAGAQDHGDECQPASCGDMGPNIRFPFWLKDRQPDSCGYGPGFALTCNPTNKTETLLDSPFSVKVAVTEINYYRQLIRYELSGKYVQEDQQNLSLIFNTSPGSPLSPFQLWAHTVPESFIFKNCSSPCVNSSHNFCKYHIFSCPSSSADSYNYGEYAPLPWLGSPGHNLFLLNSHYLIRQTLLNCSKIYTIPSAPCVKRDRKLYDSDGLRGWSGWSEPNCTECEHKGMYCRFNRSGNSEKNETECFFPYYTPPRGETIRPLVAGLIPLGLFILAVLGIPTYIVERSINIRIDNQVLKLERFLENYRALKPTRYTYAEIKKMTHKLKEKVGQGGYGTVYKGELSNGDPIAAKILNNFTGNGEDFINEVGTIGTIHHVNVVRLVGYCAEGYKKALVYEYLPNNSLQKIISSDHKIASLGWEKLQDIALGIAKGIEYLHQGCDQRILHFDIKPHNILLDKNFIPKISDFGLAKLCSKEQSVVSMTDPRGTLGYIAPEVFSRNFGNVSHKSDVYSFGMLLLEMVGGRKKNFDVHAEENSDEVYFPEWIYNRLNREEVNNNEVEEGGDAKIVKKLTVIGLWCIQWYPGDRPSMKVVVQMLEGDGETLAMPSNPFSTTSQSITRGNMDGRPFSSMLEIISKSD